MRSTLFRSTAMMLTLLTSAALAQVAPPDRSTIDAGTPGDTGPRGPLPGPNANPPQSATHPDDASNSVQPVPGAMPGSETVPSTLSEKNAADDKLITMAYALKNLTGDERLAIYRALKDQPAGPALNADIGAQIGPSVELRAIPDAVVAQVPQTRDYQFAVAGDRVLLVLPANRIVVGVFAAADHGETQTTGGGRRSP